MDAEERALPIPKGEYDKPLILGDAAFAEDGALLWDDNSHSGVYGDVILVNGRPWPNLKVAKRKYRFRVLNASISRGYTLKLSNGQSFQIIATDGGLMNAPQTVTSLKIGMAERYEIVIDFAKITAGQKIQLLNGGVKNATDYDNTGKVMQFEVTADAFDAANNEVPAKLGNPPAMLLKATESKATRKLRLERSNGMWVINGETWDDVVRAEYARVIANPNVGDVETWEIENKSGGWFHPLHIHLVDFQVLTRNGKAAPAQEKGPKDVVYVGEGETVRLLMRFGPEHGRYMIHCHNLSHEDHDMMTQFQVGQHDADCDPVNAAKPTYEPETPQGGAA
jgi:FtsP/CotA-like multicopper oxidase with cupredoxin domain